jgi:hypothetical protein
VPAVTTYCAPCLADLALVREATTAVAGTASCMAHAVLLTHPADDPQRRRSRLAQLRDSATEKLETAGPEEQMRLEILVEEYGLASAMESLVPRRRDDAGPTSRSARKRRSREGREGRPERPGPQEGQGSGDRHATAPAGAVANGTAEQQGAEALAQVGAPSGEPPAPSGDGPTAPAGDAPASSPAPSGDGPTAPAADGPSAPPSDAPSAPSADAPSAPAGDGPSAPPSAPPSDAPAAPASPPSLVGEAAPARPVEPAPSPSDDRPADAATPGA